MIDSLTPGKGKFGETLGRFVPKLTARDSPLEVDGWKMKMAYFLGANC